MRYPFVKWLSGLLIACLLTTGAARMEDLPGIEASDEVIAAEPAEAIVEEAVEIALDDSGEAVDAAFEKLDEYGEAPLPPAAASGLAMYICAVAGLRSAA